MDVEFTLDCADPARLADFWCAAADFTVQGTHGDRYVSLARAGLVVTLQRVSEPKVGKNRMHVDLLVDDVEAETVRLEGLGATRLTEQPHREFGEIWFVLADPEGNEFCVAQTTA